MSSRLHGVKPTSTKTLIQDISGNTQRERGGGGVLVHIPHPGMDRRIHIPLNSKSFMKILKMMEAIDSEFLYS